MLFLTTILPHSSQCKGTCDNPDKEFLILGGGMSGISAGKTLHDSGYSDFLILEARSEVGGRLKAVDFAGVKVELGANWIHGVNSNGTKRNPIWTLANSCGLRMVRGDHASIAAYDSSGDDVTRELPWDEAGVTWDRLVELGTRMRETGEEDISLREALDRVQWRPSSAPQHFVEWFNFSKSAGQRVEDQSFFGSLDDTTYQDFGTDLYFITDQRGYVYLVECLGKDFLDDRHFRLNTRVTSVHHSDTCVCAMTITAGVREGATREEQFCGRYGILTFSIGVLHHGSVLFQPDLPPWKRDAIRGIRFGHFTKIFMLFNETFWDTTVLYIGRALLPAERGYPLFQPLGHLFDRKPHLLMAILSGEDALKVGSQDASTTKRQLLAALRSLYPSYRAELLDLLIPDWAEDPLYQGSYSFPGVRRGASHSTLAAPVGNLFFSGEATSENFYGYVHGAYIAGVHTAYAVMSCSRSAVLQPYWYKMTSCPVTRRDNLMKVGRWTDIY